MTSNICILNSTNPEIHRSLFKTHQQKQQKKGTENSFIPSGKIIYKTQTTDKLTQFVVGESLGKRNGSNKSKEVSNNQ